jgi:hypothetical protein
MQFKNCFISTAYTQVNFVSIFSCKLYEVLFFFNLMKGKKILLALDHLFKYSNKVVMSLIKFVGLELVTIMLVSSSMDPCGKAYHIFPLFEAV